MCFYNDNFDWYAEVHRSTEGTDGPATRCIECGAVIAVGEWRRRIEQVQHGDCQICEDEFSDQYDPEQDKATCEHEYGETFSGDTCQACCHLIEVVRVVEVEAGCPEHAQVPTIGGLLDELLEHDEREKYARRAVEMFPALAGHRIVVACLRRDDEASSAGDWRDV